MTKFVSYHYNTADTDTFIVVKNNYVELEVYNMGHLQ